MSLYKLYEIVSNITIGGWLSLLVIVSLFIEVTPMKVNPIGWLGERLNKRMSERVDKIEGKLDEHVAQSYRTKILGFQDALFETDKSYCTFTMEQYDEIIDAITLYERYCKENEIDNGKCVRAIKFINRCYERCQNEGSFSKLPTDNE